MSLLSVDLEGNSASNLMQVLSAVALAHRHGRRLCLPKRDVLCGGLVEHVDDADAVSSCGPSRVYTLAPVENVFRTFYGFEEDLRRLGIPQVQPTTYRELFDAGRFDGSSNIHLTGHTTKDTSVLRAYRDMLRRSVRLASHPAVEDSPLFRGRTLVSVHVRRGDIDYLHFVLQGAHFVLGTHHYKAWLDENLPKLDKPLVYIATNGPLARMRREFARYDPVTAADLGVSGAEAVRVDHQVMRRSHVLLCGPGTFSLTAAMFSTVPQKTFYYSCDRYAFLPVDPWGVKFFTRDPSFQSVRMYPFREPGMLRSLARHYVATKSYVRTTRAAFRRLLYRENGRPRTDREILEAYGSLDDSVRYRDKMTVFVRLIQSKTSAMYEIRPTVYELFY